MGAKIKLSTIGIGTAKAKYDSEVTKLENLLIPYVEFDFSICYQSGDGHIMVEDCNNAPLDLCIKIINNKGRLSYEDYLKLLI